MGSTGIGIVTHPLRKRKLTIVTREIKFKSDIGQFSPHSAEITVRMLIDAYRLRLGLTSALRNTGLALWV